MPSQRTQIRGSFSQRRDNGRNVAHKDLCDYAQPKSPKHVDTPPESLYGGPVSRPAINDALRKFLELKKYSVIANPSRRQPGH